MFFNILDINLNYTHSGDADDIGIAFTLMPTELDYIEIGKEYAVASPQKERWLNDKKIANTSISLHDMSTISKTGAEAVQKLLQTNKNLIGIGMFNEESENDFQTYPGLLGFEVWLSSKAYSHLFNQLLNKNFPSAIDIDLEGLKYGFEPDGSHTIWDIENYKFDDILLISRVSMHYKLQQNTALDVEAAESIKSLEQIEKKNLLINNSEKLKEVKPADFKKILSSIYTMLIVISVLLAISIYTR